MEKAEETQQRGCKLQIIEERTLLASQSPEYNWKRKKPIIGSTNLPSTDEVSAWIYHLEYITLPTPVFLPGESQGRGSLVGCCLWGRTESDTTEVTQQQYCIVYMDSVFIYSSADGHLDCFHSLASVNSAPMNTASVNMLLWCARIFLNQCFEGFWIFYFFQLKKNLSLTLCLLHLASLLCNPCSLRTGSLGSNSKGADLCVFPDTDCVTLCISTVYSFPSYWSISFLRTKKTCVSPTITQNLAHKYGSRRGLSPVSFSVFRPSPLLCRRVLQIPCLKWITVLLSPSLSFQNRKWCLV